MDYYTILGVNKNADPDDIKKAYRRLAAQHHPDKGGDTAKFQEVQKAYETLSDPGKKQQYDNPNPFNGQQGPSGFHFNFGGGAPGGFNFHTQGFDMNDIFGQMFGQANPFQQRQQVFRTQISVTLEDAYNGGNQVLRLQTSAGNKVININIPKGIKTGDQVRYDNVLEAGQLIIEFSVQPHLRFDRKGNDLYCNQQISVLDLIAGNKFEFKTISGKTFEVEIKPKTQPYVQLKIAGQGMPIPNTDQYGDQIILIKPIIPDKIDLSITESILRSRNS
jgi:DnaJ-class molecular chaperone